MKEKKIKITILCIIVFVIAILLLLIINNNKVKNTKENNTFSPKIQYKKLSIDCKNNTGEIIQTSSFLEADDSGYIISWNNNKLTLKPGETVTCNATLINNSTFVAYLNKISTMRELVCETTPGDITSASDVCSELVFSITGGNTTVNVPYGEKIEKKDISNETILSSEEGIVSFTISYPLTSVYYDKDFTVIIPTIKFYYDTNE